MKKVLALTLVLLMIVGTLALPAMAAGKTTLALDKKGTVTLNLNGTLKLTATVTPAATVTWKSSKKSVADVDGSGLVTAKKEGTATITAKAGGKTAKVKVKVVDPAKPTGVSISQGKKATLNIDKTLQLTATLAPATAKATLTWKSSSVKVATVDAKGKVTPVREGTAKITVKTHNKKSATITVKVVDPYKPTKLTLAQGKKATLYPGQTLTLSPSLSPSTAKSDLNYKSSRKSVATVDPNGRITALRKGTAKITVTAKNNKKAKATITVKVLSEKDFDLTPWFGKSIGRFGKKYHLKVNSEIEYRTPEGYDNYYLKTQVCKSGYFEATGFCMSDNNNSKFKNSTACIEAIILDKASRYSLFGVTVGMDRAKAYAAADAYAAAYYKSKWNSGDNEIYSDDEGPDFGLWTPDGNCDFTVRNGKVSEIRYWARIGIL